MGQNTIIERLLGKIIKAEPGVKKVLLIDRTGAIIKHVSRFSYYPVEVEGIGAIAAAVFCSIEQQGRKAELGPLYILIYEYEEGKIFASALGENCVISVITTKEANVGALRFLLQSIRKDLSHLEDERFPCSRYYSFPKHACPACGFQNDRHDQYCRQCGNLLS